VSKGDSYPSEARTFVDEETGVAIRQVTDCESISHHLYFYVSSCPDDGSKLFFVSHRTGRPNLFYEDGDGGDLVQLTDRDDLNEWSAQISRDGRLAYFIAGGTAWQLDLDTLEEEALLVLGREATSITGGSTSCSLSPDGRYLALTSRGEGKAMLLILDLRTGETECILERDEIMHVLFSPDDSSWLEYSGPLNQRIWVIRRDGTGNRHLYHARPMEWITHESWLPGTGEIIFTDWPKALRGVSVTNGAIRTLAEFNCWHSSARRDGSLIVCDTNLPDRGLMLVSPRSRRWRALCHPHATNVGAHWAGPFPYSKKPYPKIYAPQHTHPHPSFSPDGNKVVYTSDESGYAQVYEVALPREITEGL